MIAPLYTISMQQPSTNTIDQNTAELMQAISNADLNRVRILLQNRVFINKIRADKETALSLAIKSLDSSTMNTTQIDDRVKIIKLLIEAGANPLIKDGNGETPADFFNKVHQTKGISLIKLLLNRQLQDYTRLFQEFEQKPTDTTMKKAIEVGYKHLVKQLLLKLKPTQAQMSIYNKIAADKYKANQSADYQAIGQILKEYARNSKVIPGLGSKEEQSPELAPDIATSILGYTV